MTDKNFCRIYVSDLDEDDNPIGYKFVGRFKLYDFKSMCKNNEEIKNEEIKNEGVKND